MKHSNKTDWERLNKMKNSEIDYSDIAETDYEFWEDAKVIYGNKKKEIVIKVDEDIAEWIEQIGDNSNKAINNLLRSYYISFKNFADNNSSL